MESQNFLAPKARPPKAKTPATTGAALTRPAMAATGATALPRAAGSLSSTAF